MLNVVGEIAWSCYYTDFPIIRLDQSTDAAWRTAKDLAGASALIVGDGTATLVGGYDAYRQQRLVSGVLTDDRMIPDSTRRLALPDASPIPAAVTLLSRGPDLFMITGTHWYQSRLPGSPPECTPPSADRVSMRR